MNYRHHGKRNSLATLDITAAVLNKIFSDILIQIFGKNNVRITSTPTDPVWRINFVSERTGGYILIYRFKNKISWKIYAAGIDYPERSITPGNWREVIYQIASWNLLSNDEITRLLENYCLDEK